MLPPSSGLTECVQVDNEELYLQLWIMYIMFNVYNVLFTIMDNVYNVLFTIMDNVYNV